MDYKRIEHLVDKYFDAETTIAEENELKKFFLNQKEIPENLLYAKTIFAGIDKEKAETFEKKIVLPTKSNNKMLLYFSGIAASLVFAFFLIFSDNNNHSEIQKIYAYYNGKAITDKAIAEQYTKEALLKISQNFNTGTAKLAKLREFNQSQTLIKKQ